MTGCSGTDKTDDDYDYIVDWSSVMLWIELIDKNGNDLLDPSNEVKWFEGATITYRDRIYTAEDYTNNIANAPVHIKQGILRQSLVCSRWGKAGEQ